MALTRMHTTDLVQEKFKEAAEIMHLSVCGPGPCEALRQRAAALRAFVEQAPRTERDYQALRKLEGLLVEIDQRLEQTT